jgi:threonylcarbamoyladenosine tRNA methylthiotransferase MtaB
MPQLDRALVKERAARLRDKGAAALAAHLATEQGAIRRVLVERGGGGHTEHFTPVRIAAGKPGDILAARIVGSTPRALLAEAA